MAFMTMRQLLSLSLLRLPSSVSIDAVWRHFELLHSPANTTRRLKRALGAFFRGFVATCSCVDRNSGRSGNGSGEADGDGDRNHAHECLTATVNMKVVTKTLHEMHYKACFAPALLLFGWFCATYSDSEHTVLSAPSK